MDFDTFWKLYPRRVEKFTARSAWDKALKHGTPEEIVEGARRYASERAGENIRFTKHPATWLNGGCWLDEPGANTNGSQSLFAAFDRLEQRLASQDDNPPRTANILRLPQR
jgi:hypothetical protein